MENCPAVSAHGWMKLVQENTRLEMRVEMMEAQMNQREEHLEQLVGLMSENAELKAAVAIAEGQAEVMAMLAEVQGEMMESTIKAEIRAAKAEAKAEVQEQMLANFAPAPQTAKTKTASYQPSESGSRLPPANYPTAAPASLQGFNPSLPGAGK